MDVIGKRNTFDKILESFILISSITLSIFYIYHGLGNLIDQFYWFTLMKDPMDYPMTIGSFYIGKIWSYLFKESIVSFRWLKWIFEISSILLLYIVTYNKTVKNKITILAFSILLVGSGWQNEFSPTVITNFFICLQVYLFIKYRNTNLIKYLIFLSICSSLSILIRFPNIVSVVILFFFILILDIKKKYIHSILYVVLSLVLYYVILCIVYNTIVPYEIIFSSVSRASGNTHTFFSMINGYIWDFPIFFPMVCVCLFFLQVNDFINSKVTSTKNKFILFFCLFFLFCFYFLKSVGFHKWNNTLLLLLLSAYIISNILVKIYVSKKNNNKNNIVIFILIILMSFVATAGSDTRYLKLYPLLLFFYPLINNIEDQSFDRTRIINFAILLCTLLCYIFNPLTLTKPHTLIEEKYESNIPVLKSLKITSTDKLIIEEICKDATLTDSKKVVYGNLAYFVTYISEERIKLGSKDYWQDFNDTIFVNKCINEFNDANEIYVCSPNLSEENKFTDFLKNSGYKNERIGYVYSVFKK